MNAKRPREGLSVRRILAVIVLAVCVIVCVVLSRPAVKNALVRWLSRGGAPRSHRARTSAGALAVRAVSAGSFAGDFAPLRAADAPAYVDDGQPIPDIVHFVFGLEPTFGHIKFGLIHYLAILGAAVHIRPQLIKWHHMYLPEGLWWECAKPALTLHKVDDVTHVHGKPKAMRVQHKADILRMQIMLNDGGMYIDSDVIPLRSFQELRKYPLVMGQELDNGLCNAVMLGAPNTTFINRWWKEYVHFEPDKQWAYHSVILPRELQQQHPEEVTVLSDKAFFYPTWTHLTAMYDEDDGYTYRDNYAVHLWTSADPNKREMLRHLSVRDIFTGGGSFQRVARRLLREAFLKGQLCPYAAEQVRYFTEDFSDTDVKRDWSGNWTNA